MDKERRSSSSNSIGPINQSTYTTDSTNDEDCIEGPSNVLTMYTTSSNNLNYRTDILFKDLICKEAKIFGPSKLVNESDSQTTSSNDEGEVTIVLKASLIPKHIGTDSTLMTESNTQTSFCEEDSFLCSREKDQILVDESSLLSESKQSSSIPLRFADEFDEKTLSDQETVDDVIKSVKNRNNKRERSTSYNYDEESIEEHKRYERSERRSTFPSEKSINDSISQMHKSEQSKSTPRLVKISKKSAIIRGRAPTDKDFDSISSLGDHSTSRLEDQPKSSSFIKEEKSKRLANESKNSETKEQHYNGKQNVSKNDCSEFFNEEVLDQEESLAKHEDSSKSRTKTKISSKHNPDEDDKDISTSSGRSFRSKALNKNKDRRKSNELKMSKSAPEGLDDISSSKTDSLTQDKKQFTSMWVVGSSSGDSLLQSKDKKYDTSLLKNAPSSKYVCDIPSFKPLIPRTTRVFDPCSHVISIMENPSALVSFVESEELVEFKDVRKHEDIQSITFSSDEEPRENLPMSPSKRQKTNLRMNKSINSGSLSRRQESDIKVKSDLQHQTHKSVSKDETSFSDTSFATFSESLSRKLSSSVDEDSKFINISFDEDDKKRRQHKSAPSKSRKSSSSKSKTKTKIVKKKVRKNKVVSPTSKKSRKYAEVKNNDIKGPESTISTQERSENTKSEPNSETSENSEINNDNQTKAPSESTEVFSGTTSSSQKSIAYSNEHRPLEYWLTSTSGSSSTRTYETNNSGNLQRNTNNSDIPSSIVPIPEETLENVSGEGKAKPSIGALHISEEKLVVHTSTIMNNPIQSSLEENMHSTKTSAINDKPHITSSDIEQSAISTITGNEKPPETFELEPQNNPNADHLFVHAQALVDKMLTTLKTALDQYLTDSKKESILSKLHNYEDEKLNKAEIGLSLGTKIDPDDTFDNSPTVYAFLQRSNKKPLAEEEGELESAPIDNPKENLPTPIARGSADPPSQPSNDSLRFEVEYIDNQADVTQLLGSSKGSFEDSKTILHYEEDALAKDKSGIVVDFQDTQNEDPLKVIVVKLGNLRARRLYEVFVDISLDQINVYAKDTKLPSTCFHECSIVHQDDGQVNCIFYLESDCEETIESNLLIKVKDHSSEEIKDKYVLIFRANVLDTKNA